MAFRHSSPPQSRSVSRSFWARSVHVSSGVSARQSLLPSLHLPLAQSASMMQPTAIGQRRSQVAPPQSSPVSRPSACVTTAPLKHDVQTPALHWLLAQSAAESQILVSAQGAHVPPPQSTSVSALFLNVWYSHSFGIHIYSDPVHFSGVCGYHRLRRTGPWLTRRLVDWSIHSAVCDCPRNTLATSSL